MVPFAATRNPIDVTGQVVSDMGILDRAIGMMLDDGGYEAVACFAGSIGRSPINGPRFKEAFPRLRRSHPETLLAIVCYYTPDFRAALDAAGCLVFDDPTHALRAIAALVRFRRAFDAAPAAAAAALPAPESLPPGPCDEATALAILARAGIPVMPHRLVRSADEAEAAARDLGVPAVLKIVSPDITHKTDLGGVALNLATPQDVRRAFDEVTARVRQAAPKAALAGCLVAPMVTGGVETIIGAQWDPVFGPVVMLGLGGIFVEALKDVTFRLAPFDEAEAHRMIAELRALPVLQGMRGRKPADLDALARALAQLSRFAAAQGPRLRSLDINPFLVLPEGEGALALDAVILPA
jgi:acyl-CoA synthetase (NDP forming)